jgi:uncharacterized protein (TIGR00251 family)
VSASDLAVRPTAGGVRIEVRVLPRSSRNQIDGVRDGRLLVRVTAPPVDSAANDAVMRLLADTFDCPGRSVRIVAGHTARNKSVEISGITLERARRAARAEP